MRARSLPVGHSFDALVIALAVIAQVEVWISPSLQPRAATAPLALLWTLVLLLRRRFPLAAPAVTFLALAGEALAIHGVVTGTHTTGFALLAAFAVVGAHPRLHSALLGALIGYGCLAIVIAADRLALGPSLTALGISAVVWAVGRAVGDRARRTLELEERADRLERGHEEAVAAERATIARELHDVIAHSVSVMTVQAGAARLLFAKDPPRARESLVAVEETGRQALAEMRRLLGILRGDEQESALAPQPGVANIAALADQVRSAGLPVDVMTAGERKPLSPGVDLAAYRVVQEALTNALKHAGAARSLVSIRYGDDALEITVTNDGTVKSNGRGGHGLIGMRERVTLYGGEFEAGPRDGGGYVVRASLPLDAPRR